MEWKYLYARRIGPAMFEGEALGLKAMYDTKSIRVPLPYKVSKDSDARTCTSCVIHKTAQYITPSVRIKLTHSGANSSMQVALSRVN
jgi:geranylgeranyl pyrophosphate synthase